MSYRKAKLFIAFLALAEALLFVKTTESMGLGNSSTPTPDFSRITLKENKLRSSSESTPLPIVAENSSEPRAVQETSLQPKEELKSSQKNAKEDAAGDSNVRENQPKTSPEPVKSAVTPKSEIEKKPVVESQVEEIALLVNSERKKAGLFDVRINAQLNAAAYAKSKHMFDNNYFAHTSPTGITDFYFIDQSGYKYRAVGINIAMGNFKNSQALVDAWMDSPGHRKNILAAYGKDLGVGIYNNYYTMIIAAPIN